MSKSPLFASILLLLAVQVTASDWPQFLRGPERTGDAADEELQLPLNLVAQVRLEDAITTAPAVVGGKVYVCDQMGTAYCIDPGKAQIVWKAAPDGDKAMGGNSSSPCVIKGRVYYGTTAGTFHILDAQNGSIVKTNVLGWPVSAALAATSESVYVQTAGAVIHCFDLDGNEKWRWDHYQRYTDPISEQLKKTFPLSYDAPHYAGARELCVSGNKVIALCGWDFFCLENEGRDAKLLWLHRAPLGKDTGVPMGLSISADCVFAGCPGVDGEGSIEAFALQDGSRLGSHKELYAIYNPLAVRGNTVFKSYKGQTVSAGRGCFWRTGRRTGSRVRNSEPQLVLSV